MQNILFMWGLFHRLKIPFLMIFFLMNYNFLHQYMPDNEVIRLVLVFTFQNFGLHMLNNYYDRIEDGLTGQSSVLKSSKLILLISAVFIVFSFGLVLYYGYSVVCFLILFTLMLLYSLPISKNIRIKNILYVKNITGSLFWWYLPFVLLVVFHTENSFTEVFSSNLLVLAIFLPFEPLWDIKDMKGDFAAGIKTIPNQFGIVATKLLVISAFAIIGILIFKDKSMFVISFIIPLIFMISLINEKNKLWLSRIIILFLPTHIFLSFFF